MSINEQATLNELIRRIYHTVIKPEEGNELLATLAETFKSPVVVQMEQSAHTGEGQGIQGLGLDSQMKKEYQEYYGQRSVLFRDIADNYQQGTVFHDQMASNYGEYLSSEAYHDFFKKNKIENILSLVTSNHQDLVTAVIFRRSEKVGFYSKDEIALAQLLIPHIVQSTQMSYKIGQKEVLSNAFEQSFDRLSVGVIIMNQYSHIVFANQAAEQVFSRDDGLSMKGKKLKATEQNNNASLTASIKKMFTLMDGDTLNAVKPFLITRKHLARPYQVSLMPLIQETSPVHESSQLVLAIINDPDSQTVSSEQMLAAVYQLTLAEARVVHALCNGLSVSDIAVAVSSTDNTVRFHIKNVFQKLHVKRQSELVSLILKGPLSFLTTTSHSQ
ncbi:MAG: hypothetical protein GQ547_08935 [Methylophaga sp.]|nr:hypothetical protein [Methylophaga sp.]